MFFNKTPAAIKFVELWKQETELLGNDQLALNRLLESHFPLKINKTYTLGDVKIRTFPTVLYNNYYFPNPSKDAKILHFKNDRRQYFDQYVLSKKFLFGKAYRILHRSCKWGWDLVR